MRTSGATKRHAVHTGLQRDSVQTGLLGLLRSAGCAEEIAEFKTKEDCMLVIYAIFKGMEQDSKAVEIPTQEEMEKQKDLIKQLAEAGQEVAAGIEDLLKEMFNGE